jgi:CHAD domain-containing protein
MAGHFVRRASRSLASPELSAKAVHDARKDLQRSRTALRLLRPALADPIYRRANALLRDAARTLNAPRDAKALTEVLRSLCRNNRALREDPRVIELLRIQQAEQTRLHLQLRRHPARLARTRRALRRLCSRMSRWHVDPHGFPVLGPALKRIYRSGRRALPTRRPLPTDRSLHEWRKKVKYLRYALEMVTPMRPRKLARLTRRAERLTDGLGEVHDLAMLAEKARRFAMYNRVDIRPLLLVIGRQHDRLALEALSDGEQLYRARARDWERPLTGYWSRLKPLARGWRAQADAHYLR